MTGILQGQIFQKGIFQKVTNFRRWSTSTGHCRQKVVNFYRWLSGRQCPVFQRPLLEFLGYRLSSDTMLAGGGQRFHILVLTVRPPVTQWSHLCNKHNETLHWFCDPHVFFTITITHSPITLANLSFINLVSIFRCSSPPRNTVNVRRVDLSTLAFSLSSHRHSYISLLFSNSFIVS